MTLAQNDKNAHSFIKNEFQRPFCRRVQIFIYGNRFRAGYSGAKAPASKEKLQKKVAEKYGYNLVDHKLELYGVKKNKEK